MIIKPRNKSYILALAILSVLLVLVSFSAQALEYPADRELTAPYTPDSGMLPPPGSATFALSYVFNDWDKLTGPDRHTRKPFDSVDTRARSVILSIIKMTQYHLLGANYGFGIFLPYMSVKFDGKISTPSGEMPVKGVDNNLVNLSLAPVMLQWNSPSRRVHQNLSFSVDIPLSKPSNNPANVPRDFYALGLNYNLTYDLGYGYQAGTGLYYQYDFRDRHGFHPTTAGPEGRYKNGDEFVLHLGVAKHFGPVSIGGSAYWQQQLTSDSIKGAGSADYHRLKSQQIGVGPVVTFFDRRHPKWPRATFKYSKGITSKDAVTGDFYRLTLSYTFM